MGTQFWWFYDVIAVVVVLISIFLSGKKGFMKGIITSVGCAVALFVSYAASDSISVSLYKNTARSSSISKLEKNMKSDNFILKYADYLEDMGYFISVNTEKLSDIFESDKELDKAVCDYVNNINARKVEKNEEVLVEKVREGYAEVMGDIISHSLNKFAADTAENQIREDSSGIKELVVMMTNSETYHEAAVYIVDNYTAKAYITIFRLVGFVALYIVISIIIIAIISSFTSEKKENFKSMGSHIAGGFIGLITGGIMTFSVAAVIRLWAILGNNEMLFFNSDVIDKTIVFKYFFDLTLKM